MPEVKRRKFGKAWGEYHNKTRQAILKELGDKIKKHGGGMEGTVSLVASLLANLESTILGISEVVPRAIMIPHRAPSVRNCLGSYRNRGLELARTVLTG